LFIYALKRICPERKGVEVMKSVVVLVMTALISACGTTQQNASQDSSSFEVAASLQFKNNQWELIRDGGHDTLNITHLVEYADRLEVFYSISAKAVYGMSVDTDDALIQIGYVAGASVGTNKVVIYFAQGGVIKTPNQAGIDGGGGAAVFVYGKLSR
jgi:hypothetical protein